jgi:hypothetical protein
MAAGQIDCPVCEAPATYETVTTFDGNLVRCPKCGAYGLAGGLDLGRFRRLKMDERQKILARAKLAKRDEFPKITSRMLPG